MLCSEFIFMSVCALSLVVAMPSVYKDEALSNEVQSYNFPYFCRNDWLARTSKQRSSLRTPVPYVVIHHSYIPAACFDKEECSAAMRQMQDMHMDDRGWCDVGYNFGVGSDGAAYEGRGWETLGAHSLHFNTISVGICLIGDWRIEVPPSQQLKTAKALIAAGVEQGYIQPNYKLVGHRQVRDTECPGEALYQEIQSWDHYTPYPNTYKDLVNVTELPESSKKSILANAQVLDENNAR